MGVLTAGLLQEINFISLKIFMPADLILKCAAWRLKLARSIAVSWQPAVESTSKFQHPAPPNLCTVCSFHRDSALSDIARLTETSGPVTITNDLDNRIIRREALAA